MGAFAVVCYADATLQIARLTSKIHEDL